ncbi:MAG: aminoglycoside phosphotransferase family protein [Treponema sp.]|nr:aminoglycoside phosphotransferase family protein [Treponema sp.]
MLKETINQFAIDAELTGLKPFGNGHINDTYQSEWEKAGVISRYLHQRINDRIFRRPDHVMENIRRVTNHIREKINRTGFGDKNLCTLTIIPSRDGKLWVRDSEGGWWRTYHFIENSHAPEQITSADDARILGNSIAHFQSLLLDLGSPRLHETIPDFHNMEIRYRQFHHAISEDTHNRVKNVNTEIAFMLENEERGSVLIRSLRDGTIPERICHNDAKINNILIDNTGSHVLCVIDLDTVMPGTVLFDLGDLIRTVANRAKEDEQDLSKVEFDLTYFEALLDGYLSGACDFLISAERALICEAGRNITQIMGLRFLTDYLEGDHYYRTSRPDHNLDRCRTQIALIQSMDSKREDVQVIARKFKS